ncbi:cell division protein FtsZ [Candidatus Micrarchaeota archaeon]|nr:cell division protein FtsZ [Candidatus Micrarchaeota archaeon]
MDPRYDEIMRRNNTIDFSNVSEEDKALMEFLKQSSPKIYVVGAGGSGCNTLARMKEVGIFDVTFIAMNTDAQHLLRIPADKKVLLGKNKTRGRGAGSNPEIGKAAAEESEQQIRELFKDADLVFVTCGLGGGTGTGGAPIIAKAAKDAGALCVAVTTLPFTSEGSKRMRNALEGLENLKKEANTTISIPNDKLLYFVSDLPLNAAFKTADMVLANAVKGISELVTKPGLVNLDFADVRTILEKGGQAMIGLGEVSKPDHQNRVIEAAEKAVSSPLLDLDIGDADRALINITGGKDMTLGEAEAAVNAISSRMSKDSHVIWGVTIDDNLEKNAVRVLAVISGIKGGPMQQNKTQAEDLDLEFV